MRYLDSRFHYLISIIKQIIYNTLQTRVFAKHLQYLHVVLRLVVLYLKDTKKP